ncbi:Axonemal dynein light chain [Cinara cedri]|uniref:Axonemal dynein light chain n=1 Tax=Cinara cedri TaxID=506608 RepID=A0A5E4MEY3_9HEMI|nr:Axonemal dynein light chain [Cinara cedri]
MNNIDLEEIEKFEPLQWTMPREITNDEAKSNDTEQTCEQISILEQIFPPRVWTRTIDGSEPKMWKQTISRELPTRCDLRNMMNALAYRNEFYKAHATGICEIRSVLYSLVFDEILRQVILVDEDLGAVLYRVYREFRHVIFLYKHLVEKSIEVPPPMDADDTIEPELIKEIEDLKTVNNDLTIKCRHSKQAYSEALKKKQAIQDRKYPMIVREIYKNLMNDIRRSTGQIKDQFALIKPPTDWKPQT